VATPLLSICPTAGLSEENDRLFPEVPVVDRVVMTPMWPTSAAGPESFCFDNTRPSEVACDGRWLYVADSNNHRILIYDEEKFDVDKSSRPERMYIQEFLGMKMGLTIQLRLIRTVSCSL